MVSGKLDHCEPSLRRLADADWLASSMYTDSTPVDPIFPCLNSPPTKRDPDGMNYDHMPDELLEPDQPPYGPV
jgi:hypothetical protein